MIEDATRPILESFEMEDDDDSLVQPGFSVERSEQPITLNLNEAAFALGKSMRALERSLTGKWGNKLPEGWTARKIIVDDAEEWQIIPPPGFNVDNLVDHKRSDDRTTALTPREQNLFPSRETLTRAASKFSFGKPLELQLLRELATTHKELSEERRAHLEDLKTLAELQSSMRLLETNVAETASLKAELLAAQKDLIDLRTQYQAVLKAPWWKRIF